MASLCRAFREFYDVRACKRSMDYKMITGLWPLILIGMGIELIRVHKNMVLNDSLLGNVIPGRLIFME